MRIGSDVPLTVRGGGVLVCLQGLVGLVFSVALLLRALQGASTEGNNVYGEAAYFAVIGACVIAVGAALVLGKHGARSPAVVVQLILIGISFYTIGPSGRPLYGIPLTLICALVLYLLFAPSSREWIYRKQDDTAEADDGTG